MLWVMINKPGYAQSLAVVLSLCALGAAAGFASTRAGARRAVASRAEPEHLVPRPALRADRAQAMPIGRDRGAPFASRGERPARR